MNKALLGLAAAAASFAASAAEVLEFDDAASFGGTLTYAGVDGVSPLIGTDIIFDLVNGVGTTPSGPLDLIGGRLNFTTGPNVSEGPGIDQFSGGGSFVLTGTVVRPDLSVVASGILLTGHFVGTSIVLGLGSGNGLFSGVGIDSKNPDLLAEYGIPAGAPFDFANTEIGFAISGVASDGSFTATVIDADLTNTRSEPRTPLPDSGSTGLLMAGGFIGLVLARQRQSPESR